MILDKIMDRDRERENIVTSANDPWAPSAESRRLAREMRHRSVERERILRKSTRPCPIDREGSRFIGTIGSYQIAVPVYRCPRGHEFSWRPDAGSKLVSQGATVKLDK